MLSSHMAYSKDYQRNAELMLQQFVYNDLQSTNSFLRARACWVYSEFANFPLSDEHLTHALDSIYKNMSHPDLPVRVNAAVALIRLLSHEMAINFVRPGLGSVIKIYLKLIDEIDYDELIESLKVIVEIFNEEIQPYAEELCLRLGESFVRLMQTKQSGEEHLELDTETSLTADGLMTAIRRILQSISGRFPQIFPRLEEILSPAIQVAINGPNGTSVEEGLTCLAILLYNQTQISQSMWLYF